MTASTSRMHRCTNARSAIVPTFAVNGDGVRSRPMTSCGVFRSVRTRPSPRCPLLPVIRILIVRQSYSIPRARSGPHLLAELRAGHVPELKMGLSGRRGRVGDSKPQSLGDTRARRVEPVAVDLDTIDRGSVERQSRERRGGARGEPATGVADGEPIAHFDRVRSDARIEARSAPHPPPGSTKPRSPIPPPPQNPRRDAPIDPRATGRARAHRSPTA